MIHSLNGSERDIKLFGLLLMPSWLSGFITITVSLFTVVGTIALSRYQSSSLRLDFLKYHSVHVANNYETVDSGLQANKLIANLPLLLLWGLVGLVVYMFATNIVNVIRNAANLTHELDYEHVNRRQLIWGVVKKLIFRLVVLALWIPFIMFFFHHLIADSIASALAGSAQLVTLQGAEYVLLAFVIMAASLHLHTILLRLLLLRPRIFTQSLYL